MVNKVDYYYQTVYIMMFSEVVNLWYEETTSLSPYVYS